MPSWFERVFGFREVGYEKTRDRFNVKKDGEGSIILSLKGEQQDNGSGVCVQKETPRSFHVGKFETPSVAELNDMLNEAATQDLGGLTFAHIVADVGRLHKTLENEGSVFQAASQFNCLEMVDPHVRPEDGITGYCNDRTQGPVCAMACPAGTVYRNYFVGDDHLGQGGEGKQLDTLADVEKALGEKGEYWKMSNGYAMPAERGSISKLKKDLDDGMVPTKLTDAETKLRVGVHWDTEVATGEGEKPFNVAQVYCSAVPVGYDYRTPQPDWEPLARLCLNGAYDATLAVAAILARKKGKRINVFLTKVGGGVFGNRDEWISDAIKRSLVKFKSEPIDVSLVHYGAEERHYVNAIKPIPKVEKDEYSC